MNKLLETSGIKLTFVLSNVYDKPKLNDKNNRQLSLWWKDGGRLDKGQNEQQLQQQANHSSHNAETASYLAPFSHPESYPLFMKLWKEQENLSVLYTYNFGDNFSLLLREHTLENLARKSTVENGLDSKTSKLRHPGKLHIFLIISDFSHDLEKYSHVHHLQRQNFQIVLTCTIILGIATPQ